MNTEPMKGKLNKTAFIFAIVFAVLMLASLVYPMILMIQKETPVVDVLTEAAPSIVVVIAALLFLIFAKNENSLLLRLVVVIMGLAFIYALGYATWALADREVEINIPATVLPMMSVLALFAFAGADGNFKTRFFWISTAALLMILAATWDIFTRYSLLTEVTIATDPVDIVEFLKTSVSNLLAPFAVLVTFFVTVAKPSVENK